MQVSAAYVKKYGLVYKLCIGPSALLVVADPEDVAKLTSNCNRLDNLPKLTEAYQILEAVGVLFQCNVLDLTDAHTQTPFFLQPLLCTGTLHIASHLIYAQIQQIDRLHIIH